MQDIIEQFRATLPPILLGTALDDLTGKAICWGTIQNKRSRGEIPDECFVRSGPRVLVLRDPFLDWWGATLRPAGETKAHHTPLPRPGRQSANRNQPAASPDSVDRALPSAVPTGAARTPIKNRPQLRRCDRNAATPPPTPPLCDDSKSRFLGQERPQQNPGFLAQRRHDERCADPDVTPPSATPASIPSPVDRQRRSRARLSGHAGDSQ